VCAALRPGDKIVSTHRDHGHLIAKGADVKLMMAEIQGKVTGYNRGRSGSMHIMSKELGAFANAVVGAGMPIATGIAFAMKYKKTDQVCVSFVGDGGANEGIFHESLNLAAIWKLPVVFICENNHYAVHTPVSESTSVSNIAVRAVGYNIPGATGDGNDVLAVYSSAKQAVERAIAGGGPSLLEFKTYRIHPHFAGNPDYRPIEEIESWKSKDPISRFEATLREAGILTDDQKKLIINEVRRRIEEAVRFAKESPWPDVKEAYESIFA
jgi:pyruvate dehydrogenase E1 component alpha subunit